jgi:hypothetical protein
MILTPRGVQLGLPEWLVSAVPLGCVRGVGGAAVS